MDLFEDHKTPKYRHHNKNELTYTFGFLYHNAAEHGGSKGIRNSDST